MKHILYLPLLLAGCTPQVDTYQSVLDSYAATAFQGDLGASLTGAALYQASQSRAVVVELGWTQVGISQFEETRLLEADKVLSCLDISEVSFVDASGEGVLLERETERVLMEIEFSKSNPPLVAQMQEVGQC